MRQRHWSELTERQKRALLLAASLQVLLSATAWADLANRPAALVNGRKSVWAVIIGVNFLGPIAYFVRGRHSRR
jgi:hypothetical protein